MLPSRLRSDPGFSSHSLALLIATLLFASPTGASAQSYGIEAVVVGGDTAPGTGGGTFSSFSGFPRTNTNGDVTFVGVVSGGTSIAGIFVASGGTITPVVMLGDVAPGTGGQTYTFIGSPWIDETGRIGFDGSSGPAGFQGQFLSASGVVSPLVFRGDVAPGTGGATYTGLNNLVMSTNGETSFRSTLAGGTEVAGRLRRRRLPRLGEGSELGYGSGNRREHVRIRHRKSLEQRLRRRRLPVAGWGVRGTSRGRT